jgi:hypothetical protein
MRTQIKSSFSSNDYDLCSFIPLVNDNTLFWRIKQKYVESVLFNFLGVVEDKCNI